MRLRLLRNQIHFGSINSFSKLNPNFINNCNILTEGTLCIRLCEWSQWEVGYLDSKKMTICLNVSTVINFSYSFDPGMISSWVPQTGLVNKVALRFATKLMEAFTIHIQNQRLKAQASSGFWLTHQCLHLSVSLVVTPWSSHFWKEKEKRF